MDDISNLKFIADDGIEYAFTYNVIIDNVTYGLITELNNEINCKFVKISEENGKQIFEEIENPEIIEKIIKSSQQN